MLTHRAYPPLVLAPAKRRFLFLTKRIRFFYYPAKSFLLFRLFSPQHSIITPSFLEDIEKDLNARQDYEIPEINRLKSRKDPRLSRIKQLVDRHSPNNKRLQRRLAIYLSRKFTQKTLKQIAEFYGDIRYTGVSQAYIRLDKARAKDRQLDSLLKTIEESINVECVDLTL
jgi:hypothetical protein